MTTTPTLTPLFTEHQAGHVAATQLEQILRGWFEGERKHGNHYRAIIHGHRASEIRTALGRASRDDEAAEKLHRILALTEDLFSDEPADRKVPANIASVLVSLRSYLAQAKHAKDAIAAEANALEPESVVLSAAGKDDESVFGDDLDLKIDGSGLGLGSDVIPGLSDLNLGRSSLDPGPDSDDVGRPDGSRS